MSTPADVPPLSCPKLPAEQSGPCVVATRQTGAKYIRAIDSCERCGWLDPVVLDRSAEQAHAELMTGLEQRIAMATGLKPFAFVLQTGYELTMPEAISQAMAAVSMCWELPEQAGRYDINRAKQIGLELLRLINEGRCC